jgi:hypothetical protein
VEYLAVIWLRTLIVQALEEEQAKTQEVTLETIYKSSAETDN